jgi:hypothetical protein
MTGCLINFGLYDLNRLPDAPKPVCKCMIVRTPPVTTKYLTKYVAKTVTVRRDVVEKLIKFHKENNILYSSQFIDASKILDNIDAS